MNRAEQPGTRPFLPQRWLIWAVGALAAVQGWALVDNVMSGEWFLIGCFGLTTVMFVVQTVVLWRFRRRARRQPMRE